MIWLRKLMIVGCCATLLSVCATIGGPQHPSTAAEITYTSGEVDLIVISGAIKREDAEKFLNVVRAPGKKIGVALASPGGDVWAALTIGEAIHSRGDVTIVPDGQSCASACGLIWLGGGVRMVSETAKIGFHAAYSGKSGAEATSGVGNALIGTYLAHIGLSYKAVAYLTSAAPTGMEWLHPDQARDIGIEFITVPADPSPNAWAAPPRPRSAPSAAPPEAAPIVQPASSEARAKDAVLAWYRMWSRSSTDMSYLAPYYLDTITYYGGIAAKTKVISEKQKFAARWPVRSYTVRNDSMSVVCATLCTVTGIVDWDVSSPDRGERSLGSAKFAIDMPRDTFIIAGEGGSVISAHKEPLAHVQPLAALPSPLLPASTPSPPRLEQSSGPSGPAFEDGRAARIDYERWFGSLSDDDYREGVKFWAGNRSSKPPPTCQALVSDSMRYLGCEAAKAKLANIDARRKADQEFRAGWNSL